MDMIRRNDVAVSIALVGCGYPGAALEFRLRYFLTLKITTKMNTELLLYIALSVALFIVSIYVAGLVLGIPKLIRYQKVQSLLLLKIAKKLEVDDKELERIVDVVDSRLDVPAQNTNAPFREIAGLKR